MLKSQPSEETAPENMPIFRYRVSEKKNPNRSAGTCTANTLIATATKIRGATAHFSKPHPPPFPRMPAGIALQYMAQSIILSAVNSIDPPIHLQQAANRSCSLLSRDGRSMWKSNTSAMGGRPGRARKKGRKKERKKAKKIEKARKIRENGNNI
ncbi:hypothetical protein BD289DRAFT_72674 [Coniella lustricola]|uniref:Uncharacterized protein n=1 Tax=Coniella lustricola TaxID=2025994 RepID=A0A2T2ZZS2_9PEZI|nr:hypothetical protein BD289DRAFT_72674 [Coniella lustricola]